MGRRVPEASATGLLSADRPAPTQEFPANSRSGPVHPLAAQAFETSQVQPHTLSLHGLSRVVALKLVHSSFGHFGQLSASQPPSLLFLTALKSRRIPEQAGTQVECEVLSPSWGMIQKRIPAKQSSMVLLAPAGSLGGAGVSFTAADTGVGAGPRCGAGPWCGGRTLVSWGQGP